MASHQNPVIQTEVVAGSSIDWRSVIAGAVAAGALSLVLIGFGSAIGLSMTSARPYGGFSATALAVATAIWISIVYVVTFAAGGYVTGRMRLPISNNPKEREFRDGTHGFLVWSLGTVVGAYLLASTLSAGTSKAVDAIANVAESAGQVATGLPGPLAELASYTIDRAFRPAPSAASAAAPALTARDTSDIVRIFSVSLANGALAQPDRDHLAGLVATRTGIPATDAARRVEEAYSTVVAKRAEIETRARDTAEMARKTGVMSAFLAAAVSLIGLLAAAWAASCGGRDRDENRELVMFGQTRFW